MPNDSKISSFKKTIQAHYKKNKRTFPWRLTHDPYAILVSEIMLQQTQTDRVVPKYEHWLQQFSTFEALAKAPLQKVLMAWKGLGYNRRALALKRAAEEVVSLYNGKLPPDYEKILALPGIGPYTAGAVMAFAFNIPIPIIETNIRTVFIYFFFNDHGQVNDSELMPLIKKTLDEKNPREWYYALMDYGVMLKKTVGNMSKQSRHYTKQSPFKGSNRELRAKILHLITKEPTSEKKIITAVNAHKEKVLSILSALEHEGFIKKEKSVYCVNE